MSFTTVEYSDFTAQTPNIVSVQDLNGNYVFVHVCEATGNSITRETGEDPSVTWRFKITGAPDLSTAHDALIEYLYEKFTDSTTTYPSSYGIPLDTTQIETTDNAYAYSAEAKFAYRASETADSSINREPSGGTSAYQPPEVEDSDYSFNTNGGTAHITQSLGTTTAVYTTLVEQDEPEGGSEPALPTYEPLGAPVTFFGGIGWNGEDFDGCDVVRPKIDFTITVSRPKWFLNSVYRRTIANCTGCINSVEWDGYAPGCLLFRGISARTAVISGKDLMGNTVKDWYWRITYTFEGSPSTVLAAGGATLLKRGFDYAWVFRTVEEDTDTGNITRRPYQLFVEKVYPEIDFASLNLPLPN